MITTWRLIRRSSRLVWPVSSRRNPVGNVPIITEACKLPAFVDYLSRTPERLHPPLMSLFTTCTSRRFHVQRSRCWSGKTIRSAVQGPQSRMHADLSHAGRRLVWMFNPLRRHAFVAMMQPATHGVPDQPVRPVDAGEAEAIAGLMRAAATPPGAVTRIHTPNSCESSIGNSCFALRATARQDEWQAIPQSEGCPS